MQLGASLRTLLFLALLALPRSAGAQADPRATQVLLIDLKDLYENQQWARGLALLERAANDGRLPTDERWPLTALFLSKLDRSGAGLEALEALSKYPGYVLTWGENKKPDRSLLLRHFQIKLSTVELAAWDRLFDELTHFYFEKQGKQGLDLVRRSMAKLSADCLSQAGFVRELVVWRSMFHLLLGQPVQGKMALEEEYYFRPEEHENARFRKKLGASFSVDELKEKLLQAEVHLTVQASQAPGAQWNATSLAPDAEPTKQLSLKPGNPGRYVLELTWPGSPCTLRQVQLVVELIPGEKRVMLVPLGEALNLACQGLAEAEAGHQAVAIEKLDAAYALVADPRLLVEQALIYSRWGQRPLEGLRLLTKYEEAVKVSGLQPDSDILITLHERLQKQIGWISVSINDLQATLSIETVQGQVLGTVPSEWEGQIDPGRYVLRLKGPLGSASGLCEVPMGGRCSLKLVQPVRVARARQAVLGSDLGLGSVSVALAGWMLSHDGEVHCSYAPSCARTVGTLGIGIPLTIVGVAGMGISIGLLVHDERARRRRMAPDRHWGWAPK